MPLFEYTCQTCSKRFSVLVGMTADADAKKCPHCGSEQASKRISRFAKGRTEEDLMDSVADPSTIGDMDDPRAMRKWAKELGKEMGEDLGDDFDEYMDAAESGDGDEDLEAAPSYGMDDY